VPPLAGHETLDFESSLINMNGRLYDPQVARFTTPDPYVQAPFYSQSFNRFAYVWNNPLNLVDPSGFNAEVPEDDPYTETIRGTRSEPEEQDQYDFDSGSTISGTSSSDGTDSAQEYDDFDGGDYDTPDQEFADWTCPYLDAPEPPWTESGLHLDRMSKLNDAITPSIINTDSIIGLPKLMVSVGIGLAVGLTAGLGRVVLRTAGKEAGKDIAEALGAKAAKDLSVGGFKYMKTAGNHIKDIVKRGPHKGQLVRPYMNSPLAIKEIISSGKGVADKFVPGALRFDVPGTFRGSKGTWELVVDLGNKTIYHFNFVR
jgi:RHS repeat-associated protein